MLGVGVVGGHIFLGMCWVIALFIKKMSQHLCVCPGGGEGGFAPPPPQKP